jgi:uncharacterized protein YceH (UPF0502 family)
MAAFADTAAVESALKGLMERADGPFVARLPRESGQRDVRFVELFSKEPARAAAAAGNIERAAEAPAAESVRLAKLEEEVRNLRAELDLLKGRLGS